MGPHIVMKTQLASVVAFLVGNDIMKKKTNAHKTTNIFTLQYKKHFFDVKH